MELIAENCPGYADLRDQAFMTGIMSLLDTLLDVPMDELLQQVNLGLPIHEALLVRHGRLGDMLTLVEALEKKDSRVLPHILGEDSVWPVDQLPALQVEAMTWANELAVARG
jgi:EAL and modified HD-GYP domain-containing signal transduction protein